MKIIKLASDGKISEIEVGNGILDEKELCGMINSSCRYLKCEKTFSLCEYLEKTINAHILVDMYPHKTGQVYNRAASLLGSNGVVLPSIYGDVLIVNYAVDLFAHNGVLYYGFSDEYSKFLCNKIKELLKMPEDYFYDPHFYDDCDDESESFELKRFDNGVSGYVIVKCELKVKSLAELKTLDINAIQKSVREQVEKHEVVARYLEEEEALAAWIEEYQAVYEEVTNVNCNNTNEKCYKVTCYLMYRREFIDSEWLYLDEFTAYDGEKFKNAFKKSIATLPCDVNGLYKVYLETADRLLEERYTLGYHDNREYGDVSEGVELPVYVGMPIPKWVSMSGECPQCRQAPSYEEFMEKWRNDSVSTIKE